MDKWTAAASRRGRTLFARNITYAKLVGMLSRGAEIKTTKLTDSYNYQDFRNAHQGKAILLFAIDGKKRLHVMVDEKPLSPKSGWLLISFIPPEDPDNITYISRQSSSVLQFRNTISNLLYVLFWKVHYLHG